VARIVGRILGGLGILSKGHTIETDRSGLVAEYVGQTGPKVNRVIDDALDGVLFVDEAYSLTAEEGRDQFGAEAVQTLRPHGTADTVEPRAGFAFPANRRLSGLHGERT
jgi:hypothetical protein